VVAGGHGGGGWRQKAVEVAPGGLVAAPRTGKEHPVEEK